MIERRQCCSGRAEAVGFKDRVARRNSRLPRICYLVQADSSAGSRSSGAWC